jgi:hypothetical protein
MGKNAAAAAATSRRTPLRGDGVVVGARDEFIIFEKSLKAATMIIDRDAMQYEKQSNCSEIIAMGLIKKNECQRRSRK